MLTGSDKARGSKGVRQGITLPRPSLATPISSRGPHLDPCSPLGLSGTRHPTPDSPVELDFMSGLPKVRNKMVSALLCFFISILNWDFRLQYQLLWISQALPAHGLFSLGAGGDTTLGC